MSVSVTGATRAAIASFGFLALGAMRLNAWLHWHDEPVPAWLAPLLNLTQNFEWVIWGAAKYWEVNYAYHPYFALSALYLLVMYAFVMQYDNKLSKYEDTPVFRFLRTHSWLIKIALIGAAYVDFLAGTQVLTDGGLVEAGKAYSAAPEEVQNLEEIWSGITLGLVCILIIFSRYAIQLMWLAWVPSMLIAYGTTFF